MSKRTYLSRYHLLLKKLRQGACPTWPEIQTSVERGLEQLRLQDESLKADFSKRTFQRDVKELRETFGIHIEYSPGQRGYYIEEDEYQNQGFERMVESFDLLNALNLSTDVRQFVHLEKRQPQGTENLYGLLHAIKNGLCVRFVYQKFWEGKPTDRKAKPYALKEFRNRWYLLARDEKDQLVKTFGLDRLTELEITTERFQREKELNVEQGFRHCFGVIGPGEGKPERILLSFTPLQGKYIKTLPLHHSQKTLVDNETELQVKLKLFITHDFIMELLSYGPDVKVVSPSELRQTLLEKYKHAFKFYHHAK